MADPFEDLMQSSSAPSVGTAPSDPFADLMKSAPQERDPFADLAKEAGIQTPQPEAKQPPPQTNDGSDGFWQTMGGAAQKGLSEGWQQTKLLAQATGRKLSGGDFFQDQPPPPPEVNDEATSVLNQPWSADNVFSPKKWGATIVHGATSAWPELGAAVLGGAAGGLPGEAAAFGLSTGALSLMPNYQQARASGLDHDAALTQSLKASGVDAATAGLMGLAPGVPILNALKRPVTDAMVKMGLVIPGIGVGGEYAHAAVTGQDVSPDDLMNTVVGTAGMGVGLTAVHALGARAVGGRAQVPATDEATKAAFDATVPKTDPAPVESQPVIVMASETRPTVEGIPIPEAPKYPEPKPTFFSRVQQVVDEKGPESASPQQWLATIRNAPGVKSEEVEALNLPQYLADRSGKVSKQDLLAHIEENQVRIEEIQSEDKVLGGGTLQGAETQYGNYRLPGPIARYGELKLYLPPKTGDVLFEAPHFGEENQNLLAQIRYTDRIDRDGARTLFVEEMQSDWHQIGREEGYKGKAPIDPEVLKKARQDRIDARSQLYEHLRERGQSPTTTQNVIDNLEHAVEQRDVYNDGGTDLGKLIGQTHRVFGQYAGDLAHDYAERYAEVSKLQDQSVAGVPDAPFKSSWPDLTFKRMLRYAADNGFQRIAWTNGDQQVARYPGLNEKQAAGLREFYNKTVPRLADSWAKRLGMGRGETRFQENEKWWEDRAAGTQKPVRYVDVSPAVATRIKMGLPLFSETRGFRIRNLTEGLDETQTKTINFLTNKLTSVFKDLAGQMDIERPIRIEFHRELIQPKEGPPADGLMRMDASGYTIKVSLGAHATPEGVYATIAHEFGHIVMFDKLDKAPDVVVNKIVAAYTKWREARPENETFKQLISRRDDAIKNFYNSERLAEIPMLSMTPERQRYWAGFEEWFAEQTSRWATTSAKPMNVLDRWFGTLGARVRAVVSAWRERLGLPTAGLPTLEMKSWLDSLMTTAQPFLADRVATKDWRTQRASQLSIDRDGSPEVQAVAQDLGTQNSRDMLVRLLAHEVPPQAAADAAHVDRINKAYEWLISLPQLSEINPHIKPLQYYAEGIGLFNAKIRQDMERPLATLSAWRRLKGVQSDAVARLIDDWANMRYRTPDEITNKVRRMPTADEFKKMVADNKVSDAGFEVFKKSVADLNYRLDDLTRILKSRAGGISDAVKRAEAIASIDRMVADLRSAPYFPFLRHGDFTVTVYGPDGAVKHFERFDTARQQKSGADRIGALVGAGDKVLPGFLSKDVKPLIGLPPAMLDLLADTLKLSQTQKDALAQLKLDHSPEQSFLHRLSNKNYTPGYSKDFMRSYANYWFHSSRYFARADWSDRFRGWIQETRALRYSRDDATKIDQIANFMGKHFDYVMDPKADFAALRSFIFALRLGFSPTTATLYLTQTPLGTYPWLASAFGDARALAAMGRASARLSNYYKSSSVEQLSAPHLKGIAEAMRQKVLDGGVAPELAAISEGRNLTGGFARGAAAKAWTWYQEAGGTLLHLADSWNRRIAFDAGWQLAMDNPDAKYISRARERNPQEYQRLLSEGWSPQEASAFVVGKHTVESTHFVYQRSHRPQLMWGKASALLMFKFWQQNMLFTLWNYPSVAARSLLVMGAMGGLMGLPFAQDFNGILKAIGWKLFNKDWDLDRETRQYVVDHFGPQGKELADSLLHGLSRNGMGIPTVLEALGHAVGAQIPFPNVDRSGAIGLGDVLPANAGELWGPHKDVNSVIAKESQSVSGAAFGFWFDVYKMMSDSQLSWTDAKRYEQVAPHWMANASRAYRWYSERRERDRGGNTVVKFDPNDTTQMMEILARTLGYNPTRMTQAYDRNSAAREVETYWDLRHEGLLRQAWEAKKSGDKEEYSRVVSAIRSFNGQLPDEAKTKAISADQMRQFFESRARASALVEAGLPAQKKNIPIQKSIQRIYPEAETVGRQRVTTP